ARYSAHSHLRETPGESGLQHVPSIDFTALARSSDGFSRGLTLDKATQGKELSSFFGQTHCKLGTFIYLARHRNCSAVRLDDGFDQAQAEAKAALGTALVTAEQARPDFVLLMGRNTDTGIPESDHRLIRFAADRYSDVAAF